MLSGQVPGEDPSINSRYAAMFVMGFQNDTADPRHLKASACCKHFSAYSFENSTQHNTDRYHFNAQVSAADLEESYLPPFRACVSEGQASGVMCSYNSINGIPACASSELHDLRSHARTVDSFYVTSDCEAVYDILHKHNYTTNASVAINDVLNAGMDLDCGGFFNQWLMPSLAAGTVPSSSVVRAARRLLKVQMRLGMWDSTIDQPFRSLGVSHIDTKEHRALALSAAQQAVVLLLNRDGVLPLSRDGVGSLGLVGPHFNSTFALQGSYAGSAPFLVSPLDGLRRYIPLQRIAFAQGCGISEMNQSGIAAAVHVASQQETTIVAVGLDSTQEGEAHDRVSILLPGKQLQLIERVASTAFDHGGRVVVVVISGGPVDLSAVKAHPGVAAILSAGFGGQSGGAAIADVLFGAHNPAGRLTTTWLTDRDAARCDLIDMSMRPNKTTGCPGRGYRYFTGSPVFPFAAGESYSNFRVGVDVHNENAARVPLATLQQQLEYNQSKTVVQLSVTIENRGPRAGAYTAMLMVQTPSQLHNNQLPRQQLRHFAGRHLLVGDVSTLEFNFTPADFSVVLPSTGKRATLRGNWLVRVAPGGGSAGASILAIVVD